MIDWLALIGLFTVAGGILLALSLAFGVIRDGIRSFIEIYKYKHRFDKPPKADCYCVDCIYYDVNSRRCHGFHEDSYRLVADNMFCYRATPRKRG